MAAVFVATAALLDVRPASADSVRWPQPADSFGWPQPGGLGTPVVLTYSFSNLLQADFLRDMLSEREIRAATAEAFRLWSRYAPLQFFERIDSGPPPSDDQYLAGSHPDIRIGAHALEAWILGHAFLPIAVATSGLAGDIHLNSATPLHWGLDGFPTVDFLEVMAHEIGHSLGLFHLMHDASIMFPFHSGQYYDGLGTAFLFPADIEAIQALYGAGVGSVHPIPEPATIVLVSAALLGARYLRRSRRHPYSQRVDSGA